MFIPNNRRGLQVSRTRRKLFGRKRQHDFLEHLAATCNVMASARAAGVVTATVYAHRAKDPDFRAAWAWRWSRAMRGWRRCCSSGRRAGGERFEVAGDKEVAEEFDWDKAMDLLRQHQRGLAGRTPDNRMRPTRVPIEALTAKLVRKLKALGVAVAEERGGQALPLPPPACGRGD